MQRPFPDACLHIFISSKGLSLLETQKSSISCIALDFPILRVFFYHLSQNFFLFSISSFFETFTLFSLRSLFRRICFQALGWIPNSYPHLLLASFDSSLWILHHLCHLLSRPPPSSAVRPMHIHVSIFFLSHLHKILSVTQTYTFTKDLSTTLEPHFLLGCFFYSRCFSIMYVCKPHKIWRWLLAYSHKNSNFRWGNSKTQLAIKQFTCIMKRTVSCK